MSKVTYILSGALISETAARAYALHQYYLCGYSCREEFESLWRQAKTAEGEEARDTIFTWGYSLEIEVKP